MLKCELSQWPNIDPTTFDNHIFFILCVFFEQFKWLWVC
jgi:hypothetical protein